MTALILVVSCKSADTKGNSVTVRIRSMTDIKIQNPTAVVTLYGYDESMADGKASVISQKTVSLTKIPLDVTMELPKKPAAMIHPKPMNASYYLDFYCDANENNTNDKGDLSLDGEKGFPTVDINSDKAQIFFIKAMK